MYKCLMKVNMIILINFNRKKVILSFVYTVQYLTESGGLSTQLNS